MAIQAQMYPENLGLPLGGGGSQDLFMDNNNVNINSNYHFNNFFVNGCGLNDFSLNLQQTHQQQQQQQQLLVQYQQQQQQQQQYLFPNLQQRNLNQNQFLPCQNGFAFLPSTKNNDNKASTSSTITTSSDHMPMNLSQSLAAQLEKHRQEIDRYITLQNERLKVALQEQRKQQMSIILRKLESKATALLKEKELEIAKARKRRMELEECVRKMEAESQAWQRAAVEKEAMVVSLNNSLEQLRQQGCCLASNGVDDAQSCCDDNDYYPCNDRNIHDEREQQQGGIGGGGERNKRNGMMMMMVCRFCNSRESCMVLLPCRHLCSCKACEPFIEACPLCKSPKTASIQALFSS